MSAALGVVMSDAEPVWYSFATTLPAHGEYILCWSGKVDMEHGRYYDHGGVAGLATGYDDIPLNRIPTYWVWRPYNIHEGLQDDRVE